MTDDRSHSFWTSTFQLGRVFTMRDGSTIPCRKDIFDSTLSGSARPSTSPSLSLRPLDETTTRRSKRLEEPQTLEEIHEQEGEEPRKTRLLRLFSSLKRGEAQPQPVSSVHWEGDDDEHRAALRQAYADDLWAACGGENRSEGPTCACLPLFNAEVSC